MTLLSPLRGLVLGCLACAAPLLAAAPLQLDVYNPGADAPFAVSSVIVSGQRDAVLIDAQFGTDHARQLVQRIRASGKRLTTIYISQGDPDYYFGLATLTQAFPDAEVLASVATVEHIRNTMEAKLAYWGPEMGAQKPERLVLPKVLTGNRLLLEDQVLEVRGLEGPQPDRSFVWIPSIGSGWRGRGFAEHSCVDGRHTIGVLACPLAANPGGHPGACAANRGARALRRCQ